MTTSLMQSKLEQSLYIYDSLSAILVTNVIFMVFCSNFNSAAQSRILAIMLMQAILNKVEDKNKYLKYVVEKLLKINEEESFHRKRYFNNSTTHRLKHRISQTLLILQHLFTRVILL